MSYIEKHGVHRVTVAAAVWEIPLPAGALSATVDVVQSETGSRIDVDSEIHTQVPSLLISFGLDEHTGVARYSWLEESTGETITSGANSVVINVTQNGGTPASGTTF